MNDHITEVNQKYTYEDYYTMLNHISFIVREYRNDSVKRAKRNYFWKSVIDYPIKLLLGTSISGGGLELLGNLNSDQNWIGYTRTILEVVVFILLSTKDFGNFEKKMQKYYQAASLLSSFYNIIRQQMKVKRGYEGDRDEIIKEFTETFEGIKGSNAIIQELGVNEDVSRSNSSKNVSYTDVNSDTSSDPDKELENMEEGNRTINNSTIRSPRCNTALINDMMNRID